MKTTRIFALATSVSVLALSSMPANAQGLDEIVVTAQAREQSLQDVPLSVVAVSGEVMQDSGVARLEDLQNYIPSFNMNETGIATNIFIRGIGSGVNQGFEQSVGTFIDGVYYGRAQSSRAPFLDLERVEVLRGPQTILFGKNAIGGALNITTARPSDEFEGYVKLMREFEDGETAIEGAVSVPITDSIRSRLSVRYREADGYYQNAFLNSDEAAREDMTLRGQIEMDVTDNLTANFKAEISQFDVVGRNGEIIGEIPATAGPFAGLTFSEILVNAFGQDASALDVTHNNIRSSNGDDSQNETQTYALTLDWDLGIFDVKSITAYTNLDYDELCDCDFSSARVFDTTLDERFEQVSQEIRITSPIGERFDYIGGFYYQTSEHDYVDSIKVASNSVLIPAVNAQSPGGGDLISGTEAGRQANVDADVYSVFLQGNWHFNDQWSLQVGGRYTDESKDGFRSMDIRGIDNTALPAAQAGAAVVYAGLFGITSTNLVALADLGSPAAVALTGALGTLPVSASRDESEFTPDIKLQYEPNSDMLLYASYVEGVKSGGFDFRANNKGQSATMLDSFEFDTEQAKSYELGGKFGFMDGRAELNATAFFTQFEDLQISIFDGTLGFNVGNAAEAEVMGLELDGRFAVTDNFMLTGALALTDFEFTDFDNGQCYFGATPGANGFCSYTGNTQQNLSDTSANLNADWEIPVSANYNVNLNGSLFYASEYFASATYDPALVQDAYTKIDLRAGFSPNSDDWEIAVLAKNITDEETLNFGGDTPLAGSSFGAKSNYSYWAQGRTIALQASLKF